MPARLLTILTLAGAVLFMSTAPAWAGPAPLTASGVLAPGKDPLRFLEQPGDQLRLSDEKRLTRWTTAFRHFPLRAQPSDGARRIKALSLVSASKTREVYGVLRGVVDRGGRVWYQVRIPGEPNGRIGWARARAFNPVRIVKTRLVVDRSTLRATFTRNGRTEWQAPVGIGKPSTPTPGGHFYVDREEGAIFGPVYGTNIFFTNAYAPVDWTGPPIVGIHGTNDPNAIPGRISSGCIRLRNADVSRLAGLMPVGTPLRIR